MGLPAGPSDWTACKQPCAAAAWRVHDGGGTALHGGLPPGYQTWVLSARATAASFAGRGSSAAPEPADGPGGNSHATGSRAAQPAGAEDAGPQHWPAQKPPKAVPAPGSAAGRPTPTAPEAAAAAADAAYRLLQDDAGSAEGEPNAADAASFEEVTASSNGSDSGAASVLEDGSGSGALWDYSDAGPTAVITGAEAPMGLAAFPSPRPRRWVSVAPSAWQPTGPGAGLSLHSLPVLDDSLLLGGAEQLSALSHRASSAQPPRSFPAAPAASTSAPAQSSGRPAAAAPAQGKKVAAASSQPELRLRGGRAQSNELPKEIFLPQASYSRPAGNSARRWRQCEEEPASCWRSVAAAVAARCSGRGGNLISLDLPDGTEVLQDARLQFV